MDDSTTPEVHTADTLSLGRWLVGVDGSECSRHAALWAARHAPGRATEIQLATTWNIPVSTAMTPMTTFATGSSFDALEQAARGVVDDLAAHIGPSLDIPVTGSVGQGGAAAALLDGANDCSLLVVGTRGRGGFARLVLGSTSTQCATHSTVPVAVIAPTSPIAPVDSILVAFDGSPNSTAALLWAIEFATPGSTVNAVSVWDTTPIAVGADQFFFPEASGLAHDRFGHLFDRSIANAGRDDIDIRHQVVEGQPRAVLAEHAAASDLLVLGARGHGPIESVMLGSVSTWLLHHLAHPTVVVPDKADRDSR